MGNGLIRKIAKGIAFPLAFVLTGCGPNYQIDGSNIKRGFGFYSIVENKGNTEIRYSLGGGGPRLGDIKSVYINGERYTREDTLVWENANRRYHSLIHKMDSIEENKILKIKQERINKGLKAFE